MSWSEFITRLLQTSSKVDKVAVFNSNGQPLAVSDGLQVTEADGRAILRCLTDPAHTVTRITVDDIDFRCFQGNDNALVGMAMNVTGRVMVARHAEEVMVVVMGMAASHGSFLFEVQQNLLERTRSHMAPPGLMAGEETQQQMSRRKRIIPPPSAVSQDQVLVELPE